MIAAAVRAAGLTDPETVKEFEVVMVIRAKVFAYDARDARKLAQSTSNWDDWLLDDHLTETLTGRVDRG